MIEIRNIYTKWGLHEILKSRGNGCYTYEQALKHGAVRKNFKKRGNKNGKKNI